MTATIILGIAIAAAFGYGMRKIYVSFFKAEPACCNGGANCNCCSGCHGYKSNDDSKHEL